MSAQKRKSVLLVSMLASSLLLADEATRLENISVSANKMEQNLQEIPQSISIIDEDEIQEKGIKTVTDVIKEIPNMSNQSTIGSNTSFRGLNTSLFTHSNPVVIYVDGVAYYDRFDYNPSLADVEQVEVLRGPQGTLYGKDAIGAVINIVTKNPKNRWSGSVQTEYGDDNTLDTRVNTSGAVLKDRLYAGVNGSFYHTDGWITNNHPQMDSNANKQNDRKTSAFLLWKPTDRFMAKLTVSNNHEKKYGLEGMVIDDPQRSLNSLRRKDAKSVSFEMPTHEATTLNSQALLLTYEMPSVKFESITTHKKVKVDGDYDVDNMSANSFDGLRQWNVTDFETTTQEFKLSSRDQDIRWVAGLYLDREDRDQDPYGYESDYYGAVYQANYASSATSKTQAVFAQAMIPFLEDFELTLGARYQRIKKEVDADVKRLWQGATIGEFSYKDSSSQHALLPKVALSYKMDRDLMFYASISKGYLPGGLNYTPSNATTNLSKENTFDAQKSLNYEIGSKYIGENFTLNVAIFRMDIEDIHVYYVDNIGNFFVDNAKKAHSQGVELDGVYFLTDSFSIGGSLGLIEAKYDDFNNGQRGFDGERIQETPRYSAKLDLSYADSSGLYARVDLHAQGSSTFFNSSYNGGEGKILKADGGISTDAKIGYRFKEWDLYAFVKNITDEDYVTSFMQRDGNAWIGFNEQRRFGIGAIYRF